MTDAGKDISLIESLISATAKAFPSVEIDRQRVKDYVTIIVNPDDLRKVMEYIYNYEKLPMNYLDCVTAIDKLTHIEVVYVLMNIPSGEGLVINTRCPRENGKLPSVFDLWHSADYQEREVFDLFGPVFEGHPDLRRILMSECVKGHPLLKDYPKGGDPDDLKLMDSYYPDGWIEKMESEKKRLKEWLNAEIEKIKSSDSKKTGDAKA